MTKNPVKKISKKKLIKAITVSNKALKEATPAQKRVMIANDVIAGLKANKLNARCGEYFEPYPTSNKTIKASVGALALEAPKKELRSFLHDIPVCDVCVRGGIFVCAVKRFNQFSVKKADDLLKKDDEGTKPGYILVREIDKKYFSEKQLALMEVAFEGEDERLPLNSQLTPGEKSKAGAFYRTHSSVVGNDAETRMTAIMKNVIKNKGTFVP